MKLLNAIFVSNEMIGISEGLGISGSEGLIEGLGEGFIEEIKLN